MNAETLLREHQLMRLLLEQLRLMAQVEADFGSEPWKSSLVTIDRCLALTAPRVEPAPVQPPRDNVIC